MLTVFVWPYLTMGIIMIVVISLVIFINQNVQKNNWIWVSSSKSARLRYSRSLVWVSRASWEILFKRCVYARANERPRTAKKVRAVSSLVQVKQGLKLRTYPKNTLLTKTLGVLVTCQLLLWTQGRSPLLEQVNRIIVSRFLILLSHANLQRW